MKADLEEDFVLFGIPHDQVRSFSPKINKIIDNEVSKGTCILIDGKIVRDSWENKVGFWPGNARAFLFRSRF